MLRPVSRSWSSRGASASKGGRGFEGVGQPLVELALECLEIDDECEVSALVDAVCVRIEEKGGDANTVGDAGAEECVQFADERDANETTVTDASRDTSARGDDVWNRVLAYEVVGPFYGRVDGK